ncbi:MAG: ABC transporter substrate-binding protein [Protaetiibacter sp.]
MRRTIRASFAAALTLGLALAAAGCSASPDTSDDTAGTTGAADFGALDIQLSFTKNVQNAGEYIADTDGYYADAGFDAVTLIAGPTGVEAAIASGKVTVGLSSVIGSASAIVNEEMPIRIVGVRDVRNIFGIISVEGPDAIETPEDLEGKRIAVNPGTAQLMTEALAKANGVDPSTITFVPGDGQTVALLANGDVDGIFGLPASDPYYLAQKGVEAHVLGLDENGLAVGGSVFAVSEQTLTESRELVKAFLLAEIRGWKDAIADPERGAKLAVDEYGADLGLDLESEIARGKAQIPYILTDETAANGLFLLSDDMIESNLAALKVAGIDIDADRLFDMSLLQEIYEENPDLVATP